MKTSKLIAVLTELYAAHGDVDVKTADGSVQEAEFRHNYFTHEFILLS